MSSALERLEDRRSGQKASFPNSVSHVLNDLYMDRFYKQLQVATCNVADAPEDSAGGSKRLESLASAAASPTAPHWPDRVKPRSAALPRPQLQAQYSSAVPATPSARLWWNGPVNAAGTAVPLAAANLLCASIDWQRGEAVFGSADHALYTLDLRQRKKARTLYTQRCGHSEWVTAVQHLPTGGGIVSGGMDGKLCLWGCTGTACRTLTGHAGSISAVELIHEEDRFLSSSYDKTLALWDGGAGRQLARMEGQHRAPVLQLCTAPGAVAASGDRNGSLVVWDLGAGRAKGAFSVAHQGHITALAWGEVQGDNSDPASAKVSVPSPCKLLSGGQDGILRIHDTRDLRQPAQEVMGANAGAGGRGAVSSILPPTCGGGGGGSLVVSAGADGTVRAFDSRHSLQQAWQVQLPDFPYSMAAAGGGDGLVLVGCGDGTLLAIDRSSGVVQYGLGACTAAVRTIHTSATTVVVGGDDGTAMMYEFSGH